jgi:hypothetical protein
MYRPYCNFKKITDNKNIEIIEWNENKKLSDHKGIFINIQ